MKQIRQVAEGIGSIFSHRFDGQKVVEESIRRLLESQETLEFVNSKGWTKLRAEYDRLIKELETRQLALGRRAETHTYEIQRISDFIEASKVVIGLADRVIQVHNDALRTIQRREAAARGIGQLN